MSTPPPPSARDLCEGIKELLAVRFDGQAATSLFPKGTALKLGRLGAKDRPNVNFKSLVEEMWRRIATNWVEAKCQWRGSENWRWEPCTTLNVAKHNPKGEVPLNRRLANALPSERWANEVPTGSGLAEIGGSAPGGLDFAYYRHPNHVCLIELKIDAENPASAAFQLVIYGLVLTLARLVHTRPLREKGPIEISEKWRDALSADLRVVAPSEYYSEFPSLGWFETGLDSGIASFGANHGLEMTFGFRRFDEMPNDEPTLLDALERTVPWV